MRRGASGQSLGEFGDPTFSHAILVAVLSDQDSQRTNTVQCLRVLTDTSAQYWGGWELIYESISGVAFCGGTWPWPT